MKSLMWAGSAYPESMFLGAAICWVLNGFSGPNFMKNVKARWSRISNLLFLCIYFFRKKTHRKKRDLSFKNGKAKITSTLNFLLNKILHPLFHTIITQLFWTADFRTELSSTELSAQSSGWCGLPDLLILGRTNT